MLKLVNFLENEGQREAQMLLFGQIGVDLDGNLFAHEMEAIGNMDIKKLKIKINSVGGNVFQGMSILSMIDVLKSKGIEVETECVGVAYSMAGIILVSGSLRSIVDYGTIMVHDPKFTFGDPDKESAKNLLQKMTDSLTQILENNTDLDNQQVREYMSKETTFNAKEGKKLGFVDKIKKTGKQVEKMDNHYELMVACSDIYNNKQVKPNQKKMEKLTKLLGLNPEASETAIVNAVSDIQNQVSDIQALTDERDMYKSKVDQLTNEITTLKSNAVQKDAETLIDNAIKDGKIQKEARDIWIENAKKDLESVTEMLKTLNVAPPKVNDQLNTATASDDELVNKFEALLDDPDKMDLMPDAEFKAMEEAYEKIMKSKTEEKNYSVIE